ncbi:MAG TPA: cytochrome c1 [Steroidobacteraceae bacterium]|jgi:ubiquinol-cytochrome c reductase cytochrome c1 subunit|nr:cytochrome c1 [Steroidobacteraceae bacterium]
MLKAAALVALGIFSAGTALAEEGEIALLHADTDIKNVASLQRGARNFMNDCSGCHSLKYLRYNRLGQDLKIPESELAKNLIFTDAKAFEEINTGMSAQSADWFGKQPPDLTLMARERGTDYIYSYLHGFYADKTRPWGVNNLYLPGTAMPHILYYRQGLQKPEYKNEKDAKGDAKMVLAGVAPMIPGSMKPEEYDQYVRDIVNFLDYAAEPIKATRQTMGIFVMLFLLVFFVFAYLLKKEYWKDVH